MRPPHLSSDALPMERFRTWEEALRDFVAALRPTVLVLNSGAWPTLPLDFRAIRIAAKRTPGRPVHRLEDDHPGGTRLASLRWPLQRGRSVTSVASFPS